MGTLISSTRAESTNFGILHTKKKQKQTCKEQKNREEAAIKACMYEDEQQQQEEGEERKGGGNADRSELTFTDHFLLLLNSSCGSEPPGPTFHAFHGGAQVRIREHRATVDRGGLTHCAFAKGFD